MYKTDLNGTSFQDIFVIFLSRLLHKTYNVYRISVSNIDCLLQDISCSWIVKHIGLIGSCRFLTNWIQSSDFYLYFVSFLTNSKMLMTHFCQQVAILINYEYWYIPEIFMNIPHYTYYSLVKVYVLRENFRVYVRPCTL